MNKILKQITTECFDFAEQNLNTNFYKKAGNYSVEYNSDLKQINHFYYCHRNI